MKRTTRVFAGLGALALPLTAMAVTTPGAEAVGACGDSYHMVKQIQIDDNDTGRNHVGVLNVQYNGGNGYWCATTVADSSSSRAKVGLRRPPSTEWVRRSHVGQATVWLYSGGLSCVRVEGSVLGSTPGSTGGVSQRVCR